MLQKIKKHLQADLKAYRQIFSEIISSDIGLIDTITKYVIRHKGKGLRPLLVLISARLVGQPNRNTYIAASVTELLHTATLIHDDVVDNTEVRRNFPSINAIWKNKISVLMGDYLLSKSLIGASQTGNMEVINILAETSKRMSKGELFQIEKSRKLDISEEDYFRLISDKTASLISACCELGVVTIKGNIPERAVIKAYGDYIGLAFQITDDLLDIEGQQNLIGKPVGNDLKENNITLPLIYALHHTSQRKKKEIISKIKKGVSRSDIKEIIAFCHENGGIKQAKQKAHFYADLARKQILSLPQNRATEDAITFIEYIINRKR
jgi:octaprenyl-diphosphate synthase